MDDFSMYGNEFDESSQNLEKVLIRCIESNLSLSNEKWFMLLTEGIVLGHHISPEGIKVDPTKVKIIPKLPNPKIQKDVRSFLGYVGYYHRFIEKFSKIALPLFFFFFFLFFFSMEDIRGKLPSTSPHYKDGTQRKLDSHKPKRYNIVARRHAPNET